MPDRIDLALVIINEAITHAGLDEMYEGSKELTVDLEHWDNRTDGSPVWSLTIPWFGWARVRIEVTSEGHRSMDPQDDDQRWFVGISVPNLVIIDRADVQPGSYTNMTHMVDYCFAPIEDALVARHWRTPWSPSDTDLADAF